MTCDKASFPCPACGFRVFEEPSGSYDICPVCNWEDDPIQLANPEMAGGANGISLLDHQWIWVQRIPLSTLVYDGFQRDDSWRPLPPESDNRANGPP